MNPVPSPELATSGIGECAPVDVAGILVGMIVVGKANVGVGNKRG